MEHRLNVFRMACQEFIQKRLQELHNSCRGIVCIIAQFGLQQVTSHSAITD